MSPSNDTPAKQLAGFIQKFTPEIASLAKAILAKMRTLLTSSKAAFSLSATGVPLMHRMELWVGSAKKYQQFARDYSHAAFLDTTLHPGRWHPQGLRLRRRSGQLPPAQGLHHHRQVNCALAQSASATFYGATETPYRPSKLTERIHT